MLKKINLIITDENGQKAHLQILITLNAEHQDPTNGMTDKQKLDYWTDLGSEYIKECNDWIYPGPGHGGIIVYSYKDENGEWNFDFLTNWNIWRAGNKYQKEQLKAILKAKDLQKAMQHYADVMVIEYKFKQIEGWQKWANRNGSSWDVNKDKTLDDLIQELEKYAANDTTEVDELPWTTKFMSENTKEYIKKLIEKWSNE